MKALVFSDIHGSLPVAEHMMHIVSTIQPELVILLGDILYHGPRNLIPKGYDPMGVAKALEPIASQIIAIKGNCDSEVDEAVLSFPLVHGFTWLFFDGLRIYATHGHQFTTDNIPKLPDESILLYGHTHVPMVKNFKNITLCNPGSLTLPKENHPACYGLFDHGSFSVITADGEVYMRLSCL